MSLSKDLRAEYCVWLEVLWGPVGVYKCKQYCGKGRLTLGRWIQIIVKLYDYQSTQAPSVYVNGQRSPKHSLVYRITSIIVLFPQWSCRLAFHRAEDPELSRRSYARCHHTN